MQWHDNGLEGLTFDDVLIRPGYSELQSRQDVDIYAHAIGGCLYDGYPIIVANMKSLATSDMMKALAPDIMVPAHRFQSISDEVSDILTLERYDDCMLAGSVGLNDRERTEQVADVSHIIFLELAHADSMQAIDEIRWIKRQFPDKFLVAGNVATSDATKRLFDAGVDTVKCGIGCGATCTTRLVTGCGVPQLSAILECAPCGPIIADGGIRTSGDIVKALAAGAELVMIGSLFAGTDEASGERIRGAGSKVFYGMASKEAGKIVNGNVPEGIAAEVPYSGKAIQVAKELLGGLRQGMAMVGARNLDDLRNKAVFQRVSHASFIEGHPHILDRK